MKKKILMMSLTAAMLAVSVTGCQGNGGSTQESATESSAVQEETTAAETQAPEAEEAKADDPQKNATYLKTFFNVEVADSITAADYGTYLKNVAGEDAPAIEGDLTWLSAVKASVIAADYEELALSYPAEKTKERLAVHGISGEIDEAYASYLACALDTKLIAQDKGMAAAAGEAFTKDDAITLLMSIASANGDARNYLGDSDDADIYGKIDNTWNSFVLYDDETLAQIGKDAVQQKLVTGYNVKNEAYDARFLPELTLQYGHSDIKHAHQLIGLLNSENLKAKVQLEPKVSIYEYLLDWGPIPDSTPTYEVKQAADNFYLVYAVEYDMKLEFENKEDMLAFNDVVEKYAKKYEGNEDAKGLIYESWWQPLYSTTVDGMPSDQYNAIDDCVIENGMYSLHTFCLTDDTEKVSAKLKEMAPGLTVDAVRRYCNTAFYHYLNGEDYQ